MLCCLGWAVQCRSIKGNSSDVHQHVECTSSTVRCRGCFVQCVCCVCCVVFCVHCSSEFGSVAAVTNGVLVQSRLGAVLLLLHKSSSSCPLLPGRRIHIILQSIQAQLFINMFLRPFIHLLYICLALVIIYFPSSHSGGDKILRPSIRISSHMDDCGFGT